MPKFEVWTDKKPTLEEAQKFVGGLVQLLELKDGNQLLFNEEGKIYDLPLNEEATVFFRANFGAYDYIVGDALLLKGSARWTNEEDEEDEES